MKGLESSGFLRRKYHNFLISFFIVVLFVLVLCAVIQVLSGGGGSAGVLGAVSTWGEVEVGKDAPPPTPTRHDCHYYNCFNVYRCGRSGTQRMSIYVYPLTRYVDEDGVVVQPVSREFYEMLEAVVSSEYYSPDPTTACLLLPSIDTLNQNNLRTHKIGQALAMLPHWNEGENHLLFNQLAGTAPDFVASLGVERGKALVAGAGFSSLTYRRGYDLSLPLYNPSHHHLPACTTPVGERRWLVVAAQTNMHRDYREDLEAQVSGHDLLLLSRCPHTNLTTRCRGEHTFPYPQVLQEAKFCLVLRGGRLGQTALYDAMQAGCVPVVVADALVMPFSEVLDWGEAAVRVREEDLPGLTQLLKREVSQERLGQLQRQVVWLYRQYLSSVRTLTLTALRILNDRIFPAHARSLAQWNHQPSPSAVTNPLFLPLTAPPGQGFTAVILTYDRLDSLFQVIQAVAQVPSLAKVLVVWNNQNKAPPQASLWPRVNVPLKVVQTRENKLSNRFYPYEEVETECILAIDDDINMMTPDELEFGYQVWREFPDRIVGFPPRNVMWRNDTHSWKYDSEWTNEVSMVLTGVAFYHKYWSYVYTTQLPASIKQWVDANMNCEDIAMNFLVANMTGKAPIKVTPRKKFKCGSCSSGDLSANEAHLTQRSQCVSHFSRQLGTMPLQTVEFRADPVLFLDNFPDKMKLYNNMGSL